MVTQQETGPPIKTMIKESFPIPMCLTQTTIITADILRLLTGMIGVISLVRLRETAWI